MITANMPARWLQPPQSKHNCPKQGLVMSVMMDRQCLAKQRVSLFILLTYLKEIVQKQQKKEPAIRNNSPSFHGSSSSEASDGQGSHHVGCSPQQLSRAGFRWTREAHWAQGTILHWRPCHEVWKPQLSELCLWWCLARTLGLLQAAPFSYRLEGLDRK